MMSGTHGSERNPSTQGVNQPSPRLLRSPSPTLTPKSVPKRSVWASLERLNPSWRVSGSASTLSHSPTSRKSPRKSRNAPKHAKAMSHMPSLFRKRCSTFVTPPSLLTSALFYPFSGSQPMLGLCNQNQQERG